MSEKLSHRPPEAEMNNQIESSKVAEVAAYATKEKEENMRQVGSMALIEYGDALAVGDLDGADRLLNNRQEEVQQLRDQADSTTERILKADQGMSEIISGSGSVAAEKSEELEQTPWAEAADITEGMIEHLKESELKRKEEQGVSYSLESAVVDVGEYDIQFGDVLPETEVGKKLLSAFSEMLDMEVVPKEERAAKDLGELEIKLNEGLHLPPEDIKSFALEFAVADLMRSNSRLKVGGEIEIHAEDVVSALDDAKEAFLRKG